MDHNTSFNTILKKYLRYSVMILHSNLIMTV